eukprot:CAMPEP_0113864260 /NCGR_PEP_ID=MMETSP0372-20130328/17135_1 /TAXON_ID=340204 /ORGANISM="Lankesteria abbotti" /LENGTH=346 /DNA_ID=CAMNT_0000847237 /DNA_START=84 /DNA_END=1121 /DNA_ORIENTATION=+ /assembly_acc=CAM_ASM_000359
MTAKQLVGLAICIKIILLTFVMLVFPNNSAESASCQQRVWKASSHSKSVCHHPVLAAVEEIEDDKNLSLFQRLSEAIETKRRVFVELFRKHTHIMVIDTGFFLSQSAMTYFTFPYFSRELKFSAHEISQCFVVMAVFNIIANYAALPLLRSPAMTVWIGVFSCSCEVIKNVLVALATTLWDAYIALAVGTGSSWLYSVITGFLVGGSGGDAPKASRVSGVHTRQNVKCSAVLAGVQTKASMEYSAALSAFDGRGDSESGFTSRNNTTGNMATGKSEFLKDSLTLGYNSVDQRHNRPIDDEDSGSMLGGYAAVRATCIAVGPLLMSSLLTISQYLPYPFHTKTLGFW